LHKQIASPGDESVCSRKVRALLEKRCVLVTGKGGVGKTTCAAAFALFAARSGKRVLLAEVAYQSAEHPSNSASPLSRALGIGPLSEEPSLIAKNLSAVLLMPTAGHSRFLRSALPMGRLADAALKLNAIRRFLEAAPTLAEMGVLYRILDLVKELRPDGSPAHELIVVDMPATGHALALAQIPTAILEVIHTGPIANSVREGLLLLRDASKTTSVVVTLPETLPVSEAVELVEGLRKYEIPFFGVLLNRMPTNLFTPEERSAVDAFIEGRALLGGRMLMAIDRAKSCLERLRALSLPVALVAETLAPEPVAKGLSSQLGDFA